MVQARFASADLTDADFRPSKIGDGKGTNLNQADMDNVKAVRTNLSLCVLSGVTARNSLFDGAVLERADLKGSDLKGAVFKRSNLRGANLRDVNFADAKLSNTDLSGADLRSCHLDGADMSGADQSDCIIATGMDELAPDVRDMIVEHFAWISSGGRKGAPASFCG